MAGEGVVLHQPVPKAELAREYTRSRVLLYRGDPGETFCLAVGEAQAAGIPCVVQDIGCVAERVIDEETGFVARDVDAFVGAAVGLLTEDALWRRQSAAAVERQRGWGWDEAAVAFESLMR
jgi:glycosyltransferase involved in cell wall biosynthesis